jgi:hypothetical protein
MGRCWCVALERSCVAPFGSSSSNSRRIRNAQGRFRALAARLGVWLSLGGFPEKVAGGKVCNTHVIVSASGELAASYRSDTRAHSQRCSHPTLRIPRAYLPNVLAHAPSRRKIHLFDISLGGAMDIKEARAALRHFFSRSPAAAHAAVTVTERSGDAGRRSRCVPNAVRHAGPVRVLRPEARCSDRSGVERDAPHDSRARPACKVP